MRKVLFGIAFVILCAGCQSWLAQSQPIKIKSPAYQAQQQQTKLTNNQKLVAAALAQVDVTKSYDPAYVKLTYPNGDVPLETGVCADVVIRAFRQTALDLQKSVHEDMNANFAKYPKKWGAKAPDRNIDHRRVPNLMQWFERQGKALAKSNQPSEYAPGDVVAWELSGGLTHIGLVSDIKSTDQARYQIIHNIGAGTKIEDRLFEWKIIGHYRYYDQ